MMFPCKERAKRENENKRNLVTFAEWEQKYTEVIHDECVCVYIYIFTVYMHITLKQNNKWPLRS